LRGAAGGRRLDKFTFAHGALMRFARVFDVILELSVSLRQDRTYKSATTPRLSLVSGTKISVMELPHRLIGHKPDRPI
jgi:hypothetical protein